MAELTVRDQTLTYEQIAEESADRSYVVEIEYGRRYVEGTSTDRIRLSPSRRSEVTREVLAERLAEWCEDDPEVTIESYQVIEEVECRSGELVEVDRDSPGAEALPDDKPDPGVAASELSVGDRVAYYVGGPGHGIYGYVSEGIVEAVPPWDRSPHRHSETVTDAVELDVGDRTKEIPLAWIVGTVDSREVADAIDKPREALRD